MKKEDILEALREYVNNTGVIFYMNEPSIDNFKTRLKYETGIRQGAIELAEKLIERLEEAEADPQKEAQNE